MPWVMRRPAGKLFFNHYFMAVQRLIMVDVRTAFSLLGYESLTGGSHAQTPCGLSFHRLFGLAAVAHSRCARLACVGWVDKPSLGGFECWVYQPSLPPLKAAVPGAARR
jgi:hypothetical protein